MTRNAPAQETSPLPSPAFRLSLWYALGILCGSGFPLPPWAWGALTCALWIATLAAMRKGAGSARSLAGGALLFSCGALRFFTDIPETPLLPGPADARSVRVTGTVATPPGENAGRVRFTLHADSCYEGSRGYPFPVKIAVSVRVRKEKGEFSPVAYGMRLALSGLVSAPPAERNPGEFSPRKYDESKGIVAILSVDGTDGIVIRDSGDGAWFSRECIYPLRSAILRRVGEFLPGEEGEFLKDLLLGERGGIPGETKAAFVDAGVAHVLAVSGYRVLVIAGILGAFLVLLRIPRAVRPIIACPALLFYMALTPGDPPVVRGTVMALVVIAGRVVERRTNTLNSLGVAALVILCADSHQLFDAGFQLSFGAVCAILFFLPPAPGLPPRRGRGGPARRLWSLAGRSARISVIVSAGTLPVSAACFGRVSIVGVLTNIVVVPATGAAVVLGTLALAAGSFSTPLGESYAALAGLLLEWTIGFSRYAANLPFASVEAGRFGVAGAAAWYAVMGLVARRRNRRAAALFLALLLAALNAAVLLPADPAFAPSPGLLRLSMIDVGQGDACCVEFPGGETLLVDTGPITPAGNAGVKTVIPFLKKRGISSVDLLVVTHPDADHCGGAASIIRGIRVGRIIEGSSGAETAVYESFHAAARERAVPLCRAARGDTISGPACSRLYVLWPPRTAHPDEGRSRRGASNNSSIVFRLVYGDISVLFTGDAEKDAEHAMIRSYGGFLRCTVLKVAHHGSESGTSGEFLDAVRPSVAIVSVGAQNRFGHPSGSLLGRLGKSGARVLRTDREGAVVLTTDGMSVRDVRWR